MKLPLFALALAVCGGIEAAQVDKVIVHQQWPWTADIKVEYKVTGVTSPVDVKIRAWRDGTELDAALVKAAARGDLFGIARSGVGTILIDPVAIFGEEKVSCGFRAELTLSPLAATNICEVIYKIYDLDDGSCTDVTRGELLGRKYGTVETDYRNLSPDFPRSSLSDVLIWTGVTNDAKYATSKLVLRKIPAAAAGSWKMGSSAEEGGRSQCYSPAKFCGLTDWNITAATETQHDVTLTNDYFIGVFELTQAQYAKVINGHFSTYVTTNWPSYFSNETCRDRRPVEQVPLLYLRGLLDNANWPSMGHTVESWSFLGLLRSRLAGAPLIDLPTEAQWEFACRAGTTTSLNSGLDLVTPTWEGDANLTKLARTKRSGGWIGDGQTQEAPKPDTPAGEGGTAQVGSYLPNAFGLYDMHGNVNEWCLDYYEDLTSEAAVEPLGPGRHNNNFMRVLRGGSWNEYCCWNRSAMRAGVNYALSLKDQIGRYIGVRLCLTVPKGSN